MNIENAFQIQTERLIKHGKLCTFINNFGGVLWVRYDSIDRSRKEIAQRLQTASSTAKVWDN